MNVNGLAEADLKDLIDLAVTARMFQRRRGKLRSYQMFWRWILKGKLQSWKVGGRTYVLKREVIALLKPTRGFSPSH